MRSVYISLGTHPHTEQRQAAHALLSECLAAAGAEYTYGLTPLTLGEHGKPSLAARPDIHYNLSHAKGVCACMTDADECGIDCECVREHKPRVAARVFSPAELETLAALPEHERDMFFFRIWTLKEAFVKAVGVGISYPMNTLSFTLAPDSITSDLPGWHFAQLIINNSAIVSLCTRSPVAHPLRTISTTDPKLIVAM